MGSRQRSGLGDEHRTGASPRHDASLAEPPIGGRAQPGPDYDAAISALTIVRKRLAPVRG